MSNEPETQNTRDSLFGFTTVSHAVNLSKGLTAPVLFGLLIITRNPTTGAFVYATMHGLYGALWVLKQVFFPDKNFLKKPSEVISFNLGVDFDVTNPNVELILETLAFLLVCFYWLGGISLILSMQELHPARIGLAVGIYGLGIFMHFGADIQKYERLKYKKGLITDGLFAICRSPGYFGELLLYASFFIMCPLGLPLYISIATMILGLPPFLIGKERSISRHPEYAEYKSKTALLIPFVF